MQELRKIVHSPHHLFVFEVCGRLLSFTRAAEELGVSQPAVSLAIRQMESAIGQPLFDRIHRRIKLSVAGEQFHREVSIGLHKILRGAQTIQQSRTPDLVTLSISTAFANYWIMPRLSALRRQHPDIDLRLQVVDRDLNLENENVSLGIRRGRGNWAGYCSVKIANEDLLAIASPGYLDKHGLAESPQALLKHHFIHLEEPFRPRPTWKDWFEAFDLTYRDSGEGLRLNDYALVIQAAMAGEGVALGWRHVVEPLLEKKLLVSLTLESWKTEEEFHLIWSDKNTLSSAAEQVRDWIILEAQKLL
ncbi:MAG: DNA-binding transcriptional LysR family regulator [Gammaproteobacteria bacterium]|jgi:DNA-binding transcriptional LysR family regulator